MADATAIQWADATFNPWVGCEKVSPGCAHCYAEEWATGWPGTAKGTWGRDGTRRRTSPAKWREPLKWARLAREGLLPNGDPNLDGHRPRIFCASLADVFEERESLDPWRDELFGLILATPELDWLVLTKRPEYAREWFGSYVSSFDTRTRVWTIASDIVGATRERGGWPSESWPLPNVWLGVSIENARHTWRADVLRQIPAAVRFISAEPLLGSLFPEKKSWRCADCGKVSHTGEMETPDDYNHSWKRQELDLSGIDWIIVGGESGPGARPCHLGHIREIVRACRIVSVCPQPLCHAVGHDRREPAVFVKQLGAKPIGPGLGIGQDWLANDAPLKLRDRKGGDWDEWPADLRIREMPRGGRA